MTDGAQTQTPPKPGQAQGPAPGSGEAHLFPVGHGGDRLHCAFLLGGQLPLPSSGDGNRWHLLYPRTAPLLSCSLDGFSSPHSFLIIPSCPAPLLGQDILYNLKATIRLSPSPTLSTPLLFIENPDIYLSTSPRLNPATLLLPSSTNPEPSHSCSHLLEELTPPHPGLSNQPLPNPDQILFVARDMQHRPLLPSMPSWRQFPPPWDKLSEGRT